MSGKYVDWTKFDHLLGSMKDKDLAKQIGCSLTAVALRRRKLGIKPAIKNMWTEYDQTLFETQGMIECVKCKRTMDISKFSKNKTATNGYRKECCECHQRQIKERRRGIKTYWINQMGGCCQSCGFNKWVGPLQFHHVEWNIQDRNPDNTYPHLVMYRKYDEKAIRIELDKCCLLCSVCHDAIHSFELDVTFVKRDMLGWTISSGDRLDSQTCPTEDRVNTSELLREIS